MNSVDTYVMYHSSKYIRQTLLGFRPLHDPLPITPPLRSSYVWKARHGPVVWVTTDTTGRDASTEPELIKVNKLERLCLTLIDLYQNTGIHAVQMLAHSAEGSVEVNKQSLIRLHQRTSYHLGNLVMLDNFILHLRWGFFKTGWVNGSVLAAKKKIKMCMPHHIQISPNTEANQSIRASWLGPNHQAPVAGSMER